MNCPKCNYPDGPNPGDHYKGLYIPNGRCDGCGFVEDDDEILLLNQLIEHAIKTQSELRRLMYRAVARRHPK